MTSEHDEAVVTNVTPMSCTGPVVHIDASEPPSQIVADTPDEGATTWSAPTIKGVAKQPDYVEVSSS